MGMKCTQKNIFFIYGIVKYLHFSFKTEVLGIFFLFGFKLKKLQDYVETLTISIQGKVGKEKNVELSANF